MENNVEATTVAPKDDVSSIKKSAKLFPQTIHNYWPTLAKCSELILILIVIAISSEPIKRTRLVNKNYFHVQFFATVYGAYSLILTVILIGKLIGDKFPFRSLTILSCLGCVLFIIAGTLTLADWNFMTLNYAFHPSVHLTNLILISGIIDLAIAVIFALDGFHMIRQKQHF